MPEYRNVSFATVDSFDAVLRDGADVIVRDQLTKELRNRVTQISRPAERCVFLPGRRNDVFGQVAETIWVISGRDDVPWLSFYVPRAPDFSDDDGKTWRGAYGPRLRAWAGIDQVAEWRRLLLRDRESRRVVGVLFDPARDFVPESKDIPCNNWLSWLIRDDRLHMNVAIRSNDAMWGFSGVNAFEWSVLQEMMAFWTGAEIGESTYFATSYHLYSRHFTRAQEVVDRFYGITPYAFDIFPPRFSTAWAEFSGAMSSWFDSERQVRTDPDSEPTPTEGGPDLFLASSIRLLRMKWGAARWTTSRLKQKLNALPEDDFAVAAYEFFGRERPEVLDGISQPRIARFFEACETAKRGGFTAFKEAVRDLHARKNTSYAGSWKKRGERISVLPNIARKVDRLSAYAESGSVMEGETILDTVVDLYVYAAKYRLFLADLEGADIRPFGEQSPRPFSDHDANFELLLNAAEFGTGKADFRQQIGLMAEEFEDLWRAADKDRPLSERQDKAQVFVSLVEHLMGLILAAEQRAVREFVRKERRAASC